jgi:hypothetical protein
MNQGLWSMFSRQNAKVGSGTLQTLPVPKEARIRKFKIISFFIFICFFLFFGNEGIVHKEFVPPGQTVNRTCYREVIERLKKRVAHVRPGIARTWTTPHVTRQCPSVNFWQTKAFLWSQPPYSPDLSPCGFFLFLCSKKHLKGRHFHTFDNIQKSITEELKGIPALLRTMEATPPSLCSCPSELF